MYKATAIAPALAAVLALALLPAAALAAQEADPAAAVDRFPPEAVFAALAAAYPGRFSAPVFAGGDWSISLDGVAYRWAEGRLFPAASAVDPSAYDPQPFYPYPEELPPIRKLTVEERSRIEDLAAGRDERPPRRDPGLYDRLWGAVDEASAYERMKSARFLGKGLLVHRDLLEELALVEADILLAAKTDKVLAAWVAGLGSADGYLWRDIAGTRSRSYHSYGAAIDLMPARTGGKAWYWLDARRSGLPWYELPYERRLSVPKAAVRAFERRGFVWGGKWRYWDLVHFEYRPEILILNGRSPELQARLP